MILSEDAKAVKFHGKSYPVLWDDADSYHRKARQDIADGKLCFCRINDHEIRCKKRFELQITLNGAPPPPAKPYVVHDGPMGADPSPSGLTAVRQDGAAAVKLDYESKPLETTIPRLQRKLERQKRANNPLLILKRKDPAWRTVDTKGEKWIESEGMKNTLAQLREQYRLIDESQKLEIVAGAKELLLLGNQWFVEEHGTKWWQTGWFGKSVHRHAPRKRLLGMIRIAEKAGGTVTLVPARSAKLSQIDPWGPPVKKKPLSQRHHVVHTPLGDELQQRDLFSAWLATLWDEGRGAIDLVRGQTLYLAVGPRLYDQWLALYHKAVKLGRKTHALGDPFSETAVIRKLAPENHTSPTGKDAPSGASPACDLPGCPAL